MATIFRCDGCGQVMEIPALWLDLTGDFPQTLPAQGKKRMGYHGDFDRAECAVAWLADHLGVDNG